MSLPEINKEIASIISEYGNITSPTKDYHIPINISGIANGYSAMMYTDKLRISHFDTDQLEKLVCIDNKSEQDLELNKIYYTQKSFPHINQYNHNYFSIYDKLPKLNLYYFIGIKQTDKFIPLTKWRNQQIDSILE